MPNACNQDMHEGKRIYTHLYDCLGLLGGEWLSVGVSIASASQWMMVVQWNQVKTPPTLLVGLKESIDLFASTWLWPWVGTFEIERLPPKFKTLLQSRIQHQGNHHQHSSTIVPFLDPIGSSLYLLDIIGSYLPCIKTIGLCLPDLPWPSIGWHRVLTGVTGDPHCT